MFIKRLSLLAAISFLFNSALFAQSSWKSVKTWAGLSQLLKMPFADMLAALKRDGFQLNDQKESGSLDLFMFTDSKMKYEHWAQGKVEDRYTAVRYGGKTESVYWELLPATQSVSDFATMLEQYAKFQESILQNKFTHVGLLEEKYQNTYIFQHAALGLTAQIKEIHVAGIIKGYQVYVYGPNVNIGDETAAKNYLRENPSRKIEAKKKFGFTNAQEAADSLNTWMKYARIGFGENYYFRITGKTDFDRSSIEFFAKDNQLNIRLHIPRNGSCEYGLKSLPAKWSGQTGSVEFGDKSEGYYFAFRYTYSCNDKKYENIFISFKDMTEERRDAVYEFLKKCCWP